MEPTHFHVLENTASASCCSITKYKMQQVSNLVTEYHFDKKNTLNGLMLLELAYGYGIVPILYQKPPLHPEFLPKKYRKIESGIRLVVLATINGLKRIEQGISGIYPKHWEILIERANTEEAKFAGASQISKISNFPIGEAMYLMNNLPKILPVPLYKLQGQHLIRTLQKNQVTARLKRI